MATQENPPITTKAETTGKLRRRKKSSRRSRQQGAGWRKKYGPDVGVFGGSVGALVLLIGPGQGLLPTSVGIEWIGLLLLSLAALGGILRLRHHTLYRRSWWRRGGCPNCGEHQLKRQHRTSLDRLINRAGIPRRRYFCPDCAWRGPLIDDAYI